MRLEKLVLPCLLWMVCAAANAQAKNPQPFGTAFGQTPPLEFGVNYSFFHANAPPGACGCFSLSGGGGTIVANLAHGVSVVADLSGGHASHVDGTTQNISLFNYVFGPRYSYRTSHRFTPYVEGLVGRSIETSNYAYAQNVSSLAVQAGVGVSMPVTRLIGWNVVEADYVYSRLPNGANNQQSTLRISSGILFRFGPR
jgi:outer membrane immunogenic protein